MPIESTSGERHRHRLIRRVLCVRGSVDMKIECEPSFDYGRAQHTLELGDRGALFRSSGLSLSLSSPIPLEQVGMGVRAHFTLEAGESVAFVLERVGKGSSIGRIVRAGEATAEFSETVEFWRRWLAQSTYRGRWREMVARSALTLKLLTYQPTGAIVAAPTTSLPGRSAGRATGTTATPGSATPRSPCTGSCDSGSPTRPARSWAGSSSASRSASTIPTTGPLQIMYGIDGRAHLPEFELPHFAGYRDSKPVRIGNGAYNQLQLDIYGELLDSVYLYNKYGSPISYDLWLELRRLIDWLGDHWNEPDEGIWEVRGGRQRFVYSRLMSWVAFDRGLRISRSRGLPADEARWSTTRDVIYEDIMTQGYNHERGAFVQAYGSTALDASNLLMPLVKFVGPTDARMLSTLEVTQRELVSDSLVYRYDPETAASDGLGGREGTFSMCSFWYVECLARAGRVDEARLTFEKMLTYANHLGLYAEQIGASGEALGNFPQAFTHLALISAAFTLNRTLETGMPPH